MAKFISSTTCFFGGKDFKRPLLLVWQPDALCQRLDKTPFSRFDHNAFVKEIGNLFETIGFWSPAGNDNCQEARFENRTVAEVIGRCEELAIG